jgi:hypothetical protein
MPNWVHNHVEIRGERHSVLHFVSFIKGKKSDVSFDFNSVIPIPEALMDSEAHTYGGENSKARNELREKLRNEYGFHNAIEFAVANWGTKWNACECAEVELDETDKTDTKAIYTFDTAWSHPEPIFKALSEKFAALTFEVYHTEECDNYPPTTSTYTYNKVTHEEHNNED